MAATITLMSKVEVHQNELVLEKRYIRGIKVTTTSSSYSILITSTMGPTITLNF